LGTVAPEPLYQLANIDAEMRVAVTVLQLGHIAVAQRREPLRLDPDVGVVDEYHTGLARHFDVCKTNKKVWWYLQAHYKGCGGKI
jgi:hypothetical protein